MTEGSTAEDREVGVTVCEREREGGLAERYECWNRRRGFILRPK